jgi:two-component system phosphate regulon response regulator PhoB
MSRLLTIDSADDVRLLLQQTLTQAGYETLAARTGSEGLRLAEEGQIDLVLIDLLLPDLSGTEVLHHLLSSTNRPKPRVIVLSACATEESRLAGLAAGADDFVSKPFSMRELLLRIRAVLRRGTMVHSEAARMVKVGEVQIDRDAHRASVAGEDIALTALEFRLLVALCERAERVITRDELLVTIWGDGVDVNARTVDAHVKRLRDKLGVAGAMIETVRGVGYRYCGRTEG